MSSREEEKIEKAVTQYLFQNNALSEKVRVEVISKPKNYANPSIFRDWFGIGTTESFIQVSVLNNDGKEVHNVQIPVETGDAREKAATLRLLAATIKKIGGGNMSGSSGSSGAGVFDPVKK